MISYWLFLCNTFVPHHFYFLLIKRKIKMSGLPERSENEDKEDKITTPGDGSSGVS